MFLVDLRRRDIDCRQLDVTGSGHPELLIDGVDLGLEFGEALGRVIPDDG